MNGIEGLAVGATAVLAFALFACESDPGGSGGGGGRDAGPAELYAVNCARCHGELGDGGLGPQLSDGEAVANFPDVEDQIVVVTDGKGAMPSFEGDLTEQQIRDVVDYTRTL